MSERMNFREPQRESAYAQNALWLQNHRVDGIEISLEYEDLREQGRIYYCENCMFCHSDRKYFDVDHLVPDKRFKDWAKHEDAREAVNMVILCKSLQAGDLGCNQSKSANLYVPRGRGLAFTRPADDMNCCPTTDRPFPWT